MNDLHKELKALEISLHQHNVRDDTESLELLLHPSYIEIGYSGTSYNLNSMLEHLKDESITSSAAEIWSQDYEFIDLSPVIVQILYISAHVKEGKLFRHSKRTSIWVKETSWKIQYHQATPIAPFEKS